jgi:hypothetical protein
VRHSVRAREVSLSRQRVLSACGRAMNGEGFASVWNKTHPVHCLVFSSVRNPKCQKYHVVFVSIENETHSVHCLIFASVNNRKRPNYYLVFVSFENETLPVHCSAFASTPDAPILTSILTNTSLHIQRWSDRPQTPWNRAAFCRRRRNRSSP